MSKSIIIIIIIAGFLGFRLQQIYYIHKNNKLNTFVVRFKNGTTHYIDLPEKTTRDELVKCVIRSSSEEETNIMGIYNIFGEELEYVKGVWVGKWQQKNYCVKS